MTLRGRLTAAFVAVVLGPVLLGSVFVGMTVATVSRDRTVDRLDHAAATVRTGIEAVCRQLQAVADAVAVSPAEDRRAVADQLVTRGLASVVRVTNSGGPGFETGLPDGSGDAGVAGSGGESGWRDCAAPDDSGVAAVAATAEAAPDDAGGNARTPEGTRADPGKPPLTRSGPTRSSAPGAGPAGPPVTSAGGGGRFATVLDRVNRDTRTRSDRPPQDVDRRAFTHLAAANRPRFAVREAAPDGTARRADGITVSAAQLLDAAFIGRLASASGAEVTLLSRDAAGAEPVHSTVPAAGRTGLTALAPGLSTTGAVRRTGTGDRYARRIAVVPGQPLPLVVSSPGADDTRFYALLLGVVALVGAAAVLVARWLARSTTRPLAELAWAVGRVADGDLDARVPVRRDDEMGRLAAAFNLMTRELQGSVQELTASRDQLRGHLAILGDTLSSTHDLHRILRVIMRTALAATGARAGVVLLIDPADNGTLVARCAAGLAGRWELSDDLPEPRVPLGAGMLGEVAATGEPRRGLGPAGEPACRTYVAVPVCAPATLGDPLVPGEATAASGPVVLGVLALYDRLGSAEFGDDDLLTLRTFAGQAGVAVHNVRVHEEAQRLSLTDPLTGLWNYRHLRESLRREVERATRFGRMLTVLVLDLDHFKVVNDTYGHAAGDAVLSEFARRIRIGLREVDVAFRQGGEEFVVLLPETDGYGGAIVAERLCAAIRDIPVPIDARRADSAGNLVDRIPVSVSIGIAVFPEHGETYQEVLDAADDALYAAKDAGRDTYRLAGASGEGNRSGVSPGVHDGKADSASAPPGGPQPPRQSRGR